MMRQRLGGIVIERSHISVLSVDSQSSAVQLFGSPSVLGFRSNSGKFRPVRSPEYASPSSAQLPHHP